MGVCLALVAKAGLSPSCPRTRASSPILPLSLDSRFRGNECARKGRYISMVKVHAGVCHNSVAEGNCVAARRGGEQPEANCRSVG